MSTQTQGKHQMIGVGDLVESPFNPRRSMNKEELKELAESIKSLGILQPILVRPGKGSKFEIIYGHRRFEAGKLAELETIPAIVREMDDDQAMEAQVVENLQRKDITPMDEARGYSELLKRGKYKVEDLAVKFGKSVAYVRTRLQLMKLVKEAAADLDKGDLPLTAAMELAKLDPALQSKAYKDLEEEMSPSAMVDSIRENFHVPLSKAPFDTTDPALVPKAGPCTTCAFRTGNQPDLYKDVHADTCTRPGCFRTKCEAGANKKASELEKDGYKVITEKQLDSRESNMVDLGRSADYPAPGDKSWKGWLGEKGLAAIKEHVVVVIEKDEYNRDLPPAVKMRAEKNMVLGQLKKQGVKWASPQSSSGSSTASPARKAQLARERLEREANVQALGMVAAYAQKRSVAGSHLDLLLMLADRNVKRCSYLDASVIMKRRGHEGNAHDSLEKLWKTLPPHEKIALAFECQAAVEFQYGNPLSAFPDMKFKKPQAIALAKKVINERFEAKRKAMANKAENNKKPKGKKNGKG